MGEENGNKKFDLKSFDYKKYLPYAGIALAVIVVIIIITSLMGGPKKTIKKYVSALSKGNAKIVLNSVDSIGSAVWSGYDEDDFDKDDYKEFVEAYEEYEEDYADEIEEYKDEMEDMIDEMQDEYEDEMNDFKSYKMKVEEFKDVEKLGKGLYVVKAKISFNAVPKDKDEDEIDESSVQTFVVYKNKIISGAASIY